MSKFHLKAELSLQIFNLMRIVAKRVGNEAFATSCIPIIRLPDHL